MVFDDLGEIYSLFAAGVPIGIILGVIVWLVGYVVAWAIRTIKG